MTKNMCMTHLHSAEGVLVDWVMGLGLDQVWPGSSLGHRRVSFPHQAYTGISRVIIEIPEYIGNTSALCLVWLIVCLNL